MCHTRFVETKTFNNTKAIQNFGKKCIPLSKVLSISLRVLYRALPSKLVFSLLFSLLESAINYLLCLREAQDQK